MASTRCWYMFWSSIFALKSIALGLECYTCADERWNWGSCTSQTVTCKPFQDACTSYTSFAPLLKYDPRGERWHNISKGCDTQQACEQRSNDVNDQVCDRTSYADWQCIECCTGDLCNYFITLGAESMKSSLVIFLLPLMTAYFTLRNRLH